MVGTIDGGYIWMIIIVATIAGCYWWLDDDNSEPILRIMLLGKFGRQCKVDRMVGTINGE